MAQVLDAIYEDGVLKPLEDPGLREHQRVRLEIRQDEGVAGASTLAAWQRVYEGLTPEDVAAVESLALDRSRFFGHEPR